jgi:uncharacterized protein (TIGR02284 family)
MQTSNKVLAEKLRHLTAILQDAGEGYLMASQYIGDPALATLFEKFAYQRRSFAREIKNLLNEMDMGATAPEAFLSLLHSTWKNMQNRLRTKDREEIISCCVMGENVASNYYESIMDGSPLPETVTIILKRQYESICHSIEEFNLEAHGGRLSSSTHGDAMLTDEGRKKISFLIAFMQQVSKDFEMIADDIEEPNLRNAFLAFATEDKNFAEELCCQAKHAGISLSLNDLALYWDYLDDSSLEEEPIARENELAFICDKSESLFLKLYTDALKEFLSVNTLKDIMLYQYNSIRAAFVKLRLLNSIRFHTGLTQVV